jgi:hypothetical protein
MTVKTQYFPRQNARHERSCHKFHESPGLRLRNHNKGNVLDQSLGEPLPSFRGDAEHRTRNLEIPGLVLTHHPGMTKSGLLGRFRLGSLSYGGQVAFRDDDGA